MTMEVFKKGKGEAVKPTSCYGLQPGSDLKHN